MLTRRSVQRWLFVAGVLLLLLSTALPAAAGGGGGQVLPPNSRPHGHTYAEWSVLWWQWVFSIPVANNPLYDATGQDCAQAQSDHVWFLVGTTVGTSQSTRYCTIPHGTALFFPIINVENGPQESQPPATWEQTVDVARQFMNAVTVTTLTIDGRSVPITSAMRVGGYGTYSVFPGSLAKAWYDWLTPGSYPFYNEGYYVFLAPLSTGTHTISFHGVALNSPLGDFETQVTYYITVG